ncbi:MAG: hypothetical protein HYU03_02105, partial [Thaumarchaeota archaeon]|nr:hypothetical protein [Nitrososphaerota archaeon]
WRTREEVGKAKVSTKTVIEYCRELNCTHQFRELRRLQERVNSDTRLIEGDRGRLRNEIDRMWYLLASDGKVREKSRI